MAKVHADINELGEQERERIEERIQEERSENATDADTPFTEKGGGEE